MTGASLLPAFDVLLLRGLDFDPEECCEFNGASRGGLMLAPPGCDRPAVWMGLASCCRAIELFLRPASGARGAVVLGDGSGPDDDASAVRLSRLHTLVATRRGLLCLM